MFYFQDDSALASAAADSDDSSSTDCSKENDSHSEEGSSVHSSVYPVEEPDASSYASNESDRERVPVDFDESPRKKSGMRLIPCFVPAYTPCCNSMAQGFVFLSLWSIGNNSSSLSLRYMKDSSALLAAQIATGDTVHFALEARPLRYSQLFSSYLTYIAFVCSEDGLLYRLLNGVIFGRPALDIQLIHAISSVAKQQAFNERNILEWAFSCALSQPQEENPAAVGDRSMESIRQNNRLYATNAIEHGKEKLDSIFNLSFWEKIQLATIDEVEDTRSFTDQGYSSHGAMVTAQVKNSSRKALSRVLLNRVLLTFALNLMVLVVAVCAFSVYCLPASAKAYLTLSYAVAPFRDGLKYNSSSSSHMTPWIESMNLGNESTRAVPSSRVLHLHVT